MSSSMLKQLLERVRRVTKARGAKKALADALSVQKAQVSQWLTDKRSPNAEDTLRLLKWVTEAEAEQTKDPARVSPRTGQKTQKDKSITHEKAKSDRPEG